MAHRGRGTGTRRPPSLPRSRQLDALSAARWILACFWPIGLGIVAYAISTVMIDPAARPPWLDNVFYLNLEYAIVGLLLAIVRYSCFLILSVFLLMVLMRRRLTIVSAPEVLGAQIAEHTPLILLTSLGANLSPSRRAPFAAVLSRPCAARNFNAS